MSLLGIDVGTSGCKAAIFSKDGRILGLAYHEYDCQSPQPGWAELDSFEVWQHVKDSIRQVIASAKSDSIEPLCVSSLGEAGVPVSESILSLVPPC
jgi:xylulokinase